MEEIQNRRNTPANKFRRWSRLIHRDLSFIFSGILLIYAVSGFVMNHRDKINPHYTIERIEFQTTPYDGKYQKNEVVEILKKQNSENLYTKHYYPEPNHLKVFLKGGSSLEIDQKSGKATLELLHKRLFLSEMTTLHYNPGKWWTYFSDIFCLAVIIIIITGFTMMKGSKGFIGRGGIELLIGILFPIIFLFLS
ncbi:MAG: PepSY-associated TM helix domain-containing protein [Bacteroidales bacterium]|nr:PepSY-associated TM helix domain-containing protein [Bacteroidales bacterium]